MNNNEAKLKTSVDKINRDFEKKFLSQKKDFTSKMKALQSNIGKKKIKGSPGKRNTSNAGFTEDDKTKIMNGKNVVEVMLIGEELKDHVD